MDERRRGAASPNAPVPKETDTIDAFIGARIAERRTALGLSQSALGQRLGVSFQQIQKYERGRNRVPASRLHHIARVTGARVADFLPEEGAPPVSGRGSARDADMAGLRILSATTEGRAVAAAFPLIRDQDVRRALARLVGVLADG